MTIADTLIEKGFTIEYLNKCSYASIKEVLKVADIIVKTPITANNIKNEFLVNIRNMPRESFTIYLWCTIINFLENEKVTKQNKDMILDILLINTSIDNAVQRKG